VGRLGADLFGGTCILFLNSNKQRMLIIESLTHQAGEEGTQGFNVTTQTLEDRLASRNTSGAVFT